ncbi:MAG: glycoside hydrolase family 97 protein [Bacteroidetes bacterium]|nr:glycoside hydrolase family 97 protein [Bacteroidota bacterium]
MKKLILFICLIQILNAQSINSPNNKLTFEFKLSAIGEPTYELKLGNESIILPSKLGFVIKDQPALDNNFIVTKTETSTTNETWEPVLGEVSRIKNNYNELKVYLNQKKEKDRNLILTFRLYDEGLGFRYEFPLQDNLKHFVVADELTEFNLTGDHKTWWTPGDFDTNEYFYQTSPISKIHVGNLRRAGEIFTSSPIGNNFVQTPVQFKTSKNIYINIFEAALVNYPAMCLEINNKTFSTKSSLAPDAVGNKAYLQTPAKTPWRVIFATTDAREIVASKLVLNLNEPSKIENTSWIKATKYIGIWWGMHVGTMSWNYSDVDNVSLKTTDWKSLKPNSTHGATTKRTKEYIDFAAKHGFDAVLVEGWNVGWEDWFGKWKENVFDFVTPYPDFDVEELQKYAKSKNVKMIMHHETSASVTNYERQLDTAFQFMKKFGYDAVKSGYVGKIIPRGEFHDGQWMINHYVHVAEKAAEYQIMINPHEPVRPTGLSRTYPNWLANEAARGNEFNAWSEGNPPEHETILSFTRFLGGAMDYTPGIFEIKMEFYKNGRNTQVHTTLAKQLALYVTIYSPLQMAADLPENYERYMDAFQFIKDVPVDWSDTKILEAEPGDYLTIARKDKKSANWFLGAITDENKRETLLQLNFLDADKKYTATIYKDADDADWEKNPKAYKIETKTVSSKDKINLKLAAGGGAAISFVVK